MAGTHVPEETVHPVITQKSLMLSSAGLRKVNKQQVKLRFREVARCLRALVISMYYLVYECQYLRTPHLPHLR